MSNSSPDEKSLEIARDEAKQTLTEQINTLNDIDSKAQKILRLNILLTSLILAAVSFIVENTDAVENLGDLINDFTVLGLSLLLASIALAALTYTASTYIGGMSAANIREMISRDNSYSSTQNLEGLVSSYAEWIEFNDVTNIRNTVYITLTVLIFVYGLVSLSFGVVNVAYELPSYSNVVIFFLLGIFTVLSGIIGQFRRFLNTFETYRRGKEQTIDVCSKIDLTKYNLIKLHTKLKEFRQRDV